MLLSVTTQPELDAKAIRINFESVGENAPRADVMCVILQAISKLAPYHPSLVTFARGGQERLLLDGKDVPDIAFQYDHEKPMPAWTLFAERTTRPDGTKMKLPEGLLARTTASFALVDDLMKGGTADNRSAPLGSGGSSEDQRLKSADSWHPNSEREHGDVVNRILSAAHATPLAIKDGSRLDFQQVDKVLSVVEDAITKSLTDAKVAIQQKEQGGKVEIPAGS